MSKWPENRRIAAPDLVAAKKRGEKWAMLTSYDALTAPIFEDAGVRVLLVGDSAGMVVYGHETTVSVTLDQLVGLAAGVVRSTKSALIVGDLPFGSYQEGVAQAVGSATRFIKEAGVGAVKLEGGGAVIAQVEALVSAGIPVMGHLGLTPQSINIFGSHKVQGRGEDGERLLADAKSLEHAGAFAVVLEAVPAELGTRVSAQLSIPTIGIGAGPGTDAQVLVWQDMAGLTTGHTPKFVKRYADLRGELSQAATGFAAEVAAGTYPGEDHTYF
jgi:3-methyl-2-oxobutanoate hydroxymethyltransferase